MSAHRWILAALLAGGSGAGCGGEGGSAPSGAVTGAASTRPAAEPAPPSSGDPFAAPPVVPPGAPGPLPTTAAEASRERAVLDLLEGKRPVGDVPELATEGGAPLDPGMRERVAPRAKPPQVRMGKPEGVVGLPPEVIQRIVRQNFGRFRLCYERSLERDPTLEGKIVVRFTIDAQGSVAAPEVTGDLRDDAVKDCVRDAMRPLSFPIADPPRPMRVSIPISLSPPT